MLAPALAAYSQRMRTKDDRQTDQALLDAAKRVRRGATALAARARAQRTGELSLNQTAVLGLLVKGGAMTPGEVAGRLRTQPQSLTRVFAALERRGWLTRTPDPRDGRQSLLSISTPGRQVLTAEMRPRDAWLATAIGGALTEAERDLLVIAAGLMERLAEIDASPAPIEP